MALFFRSCFFYDWTGYYCITCGATRALHSLLHGQILIALHQNLLAVALLLPMAWQIAAFLLRFVTGRTVLPLIPIRKRTLWILLIIALIFMVLRNLPMMPVGLLTP